MHSKISFFLHILQDILTLCLVHSVASSESLAFFSQIMHVLLFEILGCDMLRTRLTCREFLPSCQDQLSHTSALSGLVQEAAGALSAIMSIDFRSLSEVTDDENSDELCKSVTVFSQSACA